MPPAVPSVREGKTPVILGTGQRFRCNLISAITNRGQLQFMVFKERFTVAVFLKFLRRLLRQNPRKLFLIIDSHPVHVAGTTCRWFKGHRAALRVYFLPGYVPNSTPTNTSTRTSKPTRWAAPARWIETKWLAISEPTFAPPKPTALWSNVTFTQNMFAMPHCKVFHAPRNIVVNDGSNDSTATLAQNAGALVCGWRKSRGYSAAVVHGIATALDNRANLILTTDGDGAHDTDNIANLIKRHRADNASITIGDRFCFPRVEINSSKILANRIATALVSRVYSRRWCPADVASGCRVFSSALASKLIRSGDKMPRFGLCYFSILVALRERMRVSSNPITVRYDGSHLLYTRSSEFLDLVNTLIPFATAQYISTLIRIKGAIICGYPLRFELNDSIIFAIPIPQVSGYIFQLHDAFYDSSTVPSKKALLVRLRISPESGAR